MTEAEPRRVLFLCSGNYYRSRFAELFFNHLAEAAGVAYRADSAGLWPECHTHNPGPMSPHTIAALRERGVRLPAVLRTPRDVQQSDIEQSTITVALKEAEHRSLVMTRFPALLDRVEFWHVDDVGRRTAQRRAADDRASGS
ncbi:MAG: low molecular weight phosphatase family protein [Pseudomonadota bacterium]